MLKYIRTSKGYHLFSINVLHSTVKDSGITEEPISAGRLMIRLDGEGWKIQCFGDSPTLKIGSMEDDSSELKAWLRHDQVSYQLTSDGKVYIQPYENVHSQIYDNVVCVGMINLIDGTIVLGEPLFGNTVICRNAVMNWIQECAGLETEYAL